jgi:hypothetical protein
MSQSIVEAITPLMFLPATVALPVGMICGAVDGSGKRCHGAYAAGVLTVVVAAPLMWLFSFPTNSPAAYLQAFVGLPLLGLIVGMTAGYGLARLLWRLITWTPEDLQDPAPNTIKNQE